MAYYEAESSSEKINNGKFISQFRPECSPIVLETEDSIPGRVIPKTKKMVLDVALLSI